MTDCEDKDSVTMRKYLDNALDNLHKIGVRAWLNDDMELYGLIQCKKKDLRDSIKVYDGWEDYLFHQEQFTCESLSEEYNCISKKYGDDLFILRRNEPYFINFYKLRKKLKEYNKKLYVLEYNKDCDGDFILIKVI